MIGAFLLLAIPLCPLIDANRGITHAFSTPIPHHWLLPGHHARFQYLYAPSVTLAGASRTFSVSLCPIICFCRGITHGFSISMPHHWLLLGHHTHILHLYTPSLAFAGASYTLSATLCPLNGAYTGASTIFTALPYPFAGIFPN